jgi:hypothetical protein
MLCVIMLSVVMLGVIMLCVIMLCVIMLGVVMLCVVMPSVIAAYQRLLNNVMEEFVKRQIMMGTDKTILRST